MQFDKLVSISKNNRLTVDKFLNVFEICGIKFNDSQLKVILEHKFGDNISRGPLRIISCAGSGKTTTIIAKILKMELLDGVDPSSILAITFSRKAALDMKNKHKKYASMFGIKSNVEFRTFHSLFLKILKMYMLDKKIMSEQERYQVLGNIVKKYEKYIKTRYGSITLLGEDIREEFLSLYTYFSNNLLLEKENVINDYRIHTSYIDYELYLNILNDYKNYKNSHNVKDFEDIQLMCYELLKIKPELLLKAGANWEYFIIDEFQDISKIQLEIIKGIIGDRAYGLVVIGDDDQSIYGWRGSNVKYIVEMPLMFKNTKTIIIDTNFRCPSNIVDKASVLINKNIYRNSKNIKALKEDGDIIIERCESKIECAEKAYERLMYLYNNTNDTIGVIYRQNIQPMIIVDKLIHNEIPFVAGNFLFLHEFFIFKDILQLSQIFNSPNLDMIRKTEEWITKIVPVEYKNLEIIIEKSKQTTKLSEFLKFVIDNAIDTIDKEALKRFFITYLSTKVSLNDSEVYKKFLEDLYNYYAVYLMRVSKKVNISPLELMLYYKYIIEEIVTKYKFGYSDFRHHYSYLVSKASLIRNCSKELVEYDDINGINTDDLNFDNIERVIPRYNRSILNDYINTVNTRVSVLSMHMVKGLEFDHIIIIDNSYDIQPNYSVVNRIKKFASDKYKDSNIVESIIREYIEEERRLEYVALTRAKKSLYINYNKSCSEFLTEAELV